MKSKVCNSRFWLNESGWNPNGNKQVGWSELLTIRQSDGGEIRIGQEILAASSRAN
jgi:hypothetical protein